MTFQPSLILLKFLFPFYRNFSQSRELAQWDFPNDSMDNHQYRQNSPKARLRDMRTVREPAKMASRLSLKNFDRFQICSEAKQFIPKVHL